MKNLKIFLPTIVLSLLVSFGAFGQILKYSQLPYMQGYDFSSETTVPSEVADEWVCVGGTPITEVRWWGSYYQATMYQDRNSNGYTDPTMSSPAMEIITSFVISIYDNVPGDPNTMYSHDHPGDLVSGYSLQTILIANVARQLYGVSTKPGSAYENVWQYHATLPEIFNQEADETYWLSIQAVHTSTTIQWGWHQTEKTVQGPGEDAVQKGDFPDADPCYWYFIPDTEMAFELYSVPEPSVLALFSASAGVLGILIRRRRK